MLPVDESAKSGARVYARWAGVAPLLPVRFDGLYWAAEGFLFPSGYNFRSDEPIGYLPASYVEQAGALRADLKGWHDTYPEDETTAELIAKTEWPEGGAA